MLHQFYYKLRDSFAARINYRLCYDQQCREFTQVALHTIAPGVTADSVAEHEVIVSLTSHGRRIHDAYLAIESIMQGSILPNRILLWLSDELKSTLLPQTLFNQCERGLEIYYTHDIGPYTKLIPTLLRHSDAIIVTIDDDILYPYDTLELLLHAHEVHPSLICANRIIEARYKREGQLAHFYQWSPLKDVNSIKRTNFFEGLGGVLYPPHCFNEEVFNSEVFLKICPTADDIWFNAMALIQGTLCVMSNTHYAHLPLLFNESVQDIGLWRINNAKKNCPHDRQLNAVFNHYNLQY